ncbi:MAG: hypothetical protein M5U28_37470 [Sandaracinaceae bacterium]|nr:hypothetical protein [Sandaracinaceae bacterium]
MRAHLSSPARTAASAPPPATFAEALAPHAIDMATLHARHAPLLELVRRLIGVVPNCDPYLEIWPTAFRTYNVMVPNLLNLPLLLVGASVDKAMLGMAMYASSRAASCAYCSAHTCAFALRRGAAADKVARIATEDRSALDARELAVVDVAEAISVVPSALTDAQRAALRRGFSEADVEWIVLGVAMMGFLNKWMDALGVELEQASVDEVEGVIGGSGWSSGKHRVVPTSPELTLSSRPDGLRVLASLLPSLPGAIARDLRWTKGVPSKAAAARAWIEREVGADLPMIARLTHGRAIRAIATMVRDNLVARDTQLGLRAKHLAAVVFGRVVEDEALVALGRELATRGGVDRDVLEAVAGGALEVRDGLDERTRVALLTARALSPSPAGSSPELIERATRILGPAGVVELVTLLSVLQMLHRLAVFYAA